MSQIQVEEISTIETPGSAYWPTVTKTHIGELVAVYSGGRQRHICPFGQVHYITSTDEGRNWTWPRVLVVGPLDDRDAGVLETRGSTLIVNWFTSLAWERKLQEQPEIFKDYPAAEYAEWLRRRERLTDDVRQRELGAWCIRSTDGGHTWSAKIPTLVSSPHGPCELSDGRLLYAGNKVVDHFSQSDGGKTWSEVHSLGFRGYPAFLMRLSDGRLITTVGHRKRDPRGNQVAVSEDHGKSWSEPAVLNSDSIHDFGYPSTVELSPGRFLTLWYDRKGSDQGYLRQAYWRLK